MIMEGRAGVLSAHQGLLCGYRNQVTLRPALSTPCRAVLPHLRPGKRPTMRFRAPPRSCLWVLRSIRAALAAAALLALLWSGGLAWFADAAREGRQQPARATEAIVVPTGGSGRLEEGLRLLESGLAQALFVTGVAEGVESAELRARNDPALWACCVALGYEADDTAANAREAAAWMAGRSFTSLRLVTGGYHMPRAMMEFRSAMPSATLLAHPVFPEHVKVEHWWRYRGTTGLIASEFTKYLWALARRTLGLGKRRRTPWRTRSARRSVRSHSTLGG